MTTLSSLLPVNSCRYGETARLAYQLSFSLKVWSGRDVSGSLLPGEVFPEVIPLLLSQIKKFWSLCAAQWLISAGPCMSCERNNPAAKFLGWKFSTLLCAKAAALCYICIILSHLGKNRCRTEISTARISLPYDTQFKQKKCFETPSTLSEECRRRRCVSERQCCPCSGLFWELHYFCYTQLNLFSLLCRLNCFAMKVGDPLEKVSCFGISLFLNTTKVITSQLQVQRKPLKMKVLETKW